jgi:hypothetical protein
MAEEDMPEVKIAREVLRRMLQGKSLGQISVELGKARNYLVRMLNGVIPFSMNAAVKALHAAGISPADYFQQVADECAGVQGAQESDAVKGPKGSPEAPPSLRRIESRVDEINVILIQLAAKLSAQ